MTPNTQQTIDALSDLITQEREALLAGDLDILTDLLERKEVLTNELAELSPPRRLVAPLQDRLRRNQDLFDQTLAGLRNVTDRIVALNRLRTGMETYDAQGEKTTIATQKGSRLERRA